MLMRRQKRPPLGPYPMSNGPARPRPATRTRTSGSKPSTNVSPTPAACGTPRRLSPPGAPPAAADKGPNPMALPTNTFTTYTAVGNREDLSDMIYRIDPTDTPFMTAIDKAKASAVNHEWQTQALAAANTANAQLESDDAPADATTPTVRLGHLCQISRKVPQVSCTQPSMDGRALFRNSRNS